MDDIAAQLGMSKKTLYATFSSKMALVEAVILDKFADVEADLAQVAVDSVEDVVGGLQRTLSCLQGHVSELQPPFLRDVAKQGSELFGLVERRRTEVIRRHFAKMLDCGRKSGVVRSDVPPELVIQVLTGAVQGVLTPHNLAELGLTPRDGVSAVVSVFLEGVLTDKGRAQS
jgi:AcrR family transcriptional regulator